jgi:PhoH-like ATPase
MPKKQRKIFVLDTNVILHDSSCIYNFQEHDVILPITVLEELDHFKKGNETINYHARAFIRNLDSLSEERVFDTGVNIGPGHGNILIKLEQTFHEDLILNFSPQQADHHILNIAYQHAKEHPARQVILVTKDGNFRMKAKSVGLLAQDYTTDRVKDISTLYTGRRIEEQIPEDCINKLYQEPYEIESAELQLQEPLRAHEYIILRNGRKSALGTYDPLSDIVKRVDKFSAYGITPRNAEQTFALHALTNDNVQLVSLSGKAGTGKNLISIGCGAGTT